MKTRKTATIAYRLAHLVRKRVDLSAAGASNSPSPVSSMELQHAAETWLNDLSGLFKTALHHQATGLPPRGNNALSIGRSGFDDRQVVAGPDRFALRHAIGPELRDTTPRAWGLDAMDPVGPRRNTPSTA